MLNAPILDSTQAAEFIKTQTRVVQPKFDTISDFEITYTDGGRWHKVDLNMNEFLCLLQSGELDERKVCAVKVLCVASGNADDDVISFIYDFVLLHTERNPWRLL